MKNRKNSKLSEKALKKVNRKSVEAGEIWEGEEKKKGDNFSTESEDALHSNAQINKNLGEY